MTGLSRQVVAVVVGLACVTPLGAQKPTVKVEFRRAETKPAPGLTEATVPDTTEKVYLHKTADATNADIAEARADVDAAQQPYVLITFTKDGARKMAKLSEEHKDKPLAILVNGKVLSAPVIRGKFSKEVQISGNFTREEVAKLVRGINGK